MRKIKQVSNIVGKKTRTRADMYQGVRSFGHTVTQEHSGLWDLQVSAQHTLCSEVHFANSMIMQFSTIKQTELILLKRSRYLPLRECASHARGLT